MEAILYENLIRMVFKSGRTYKNGADADIYRKMNRAFIELDAKAMRYTQDEREINFNQSFASVRNHVYAAVIRAKDILKYKVTPEESAIIDSILQELNLRFYDKERLDKIVYNMTDLFVKYLPK